MKCPQCGGKTRVIDTRLRVTDNAPRRRHCCGMCGHRFSTIESIVNACRVPRRDPLGIEGKDRKIERLKSELTDTRQMIAKMIVERA